METRPVLRVDLTVLELYQELTKADTFDRFTQARENKEMLYVGSASEKPPRATLIAEEGVMTQIFPQLKGKDGR
jgi:hypothetical protein